ncbi:MAG: nucleoside deaminase [Myxococcota bacterium]|jgi:tRNA(adenine34) deaminase|nr:nucleoside deaminase [Myxococcota bacterium]
MQLALHYARLAELAGDVPVGAVVVVSGQIAGWGQNTRQAQTHLLGHAELNALEMACRHVGDWRLPRSTLYVTLEPCVMCAGAALQARVERLVFACRDPRAGAVRSLFALCEDPRLNHRIEVREGVLAEDAQALLGRFFEKLRVDSRKL